ncbi:MAG: hypothetical protein KJT01_02325 [Gemmatimonadetes bacterium]|nr:hypothetical protein [Gemmatimonadota bacterium]
MSGGAVRPLATIDAPSPQGTLDRLHNSGWGRPPEQYRTPMLGHHVLLDVPLLLGAWTEVPPVERAALQAAIRATRYKRNGRPLPLAMLGRVVARARLSVERAHGEALRAAGVAVDPDRDLPARPDALRELARLRDRVNALEWTAGIVFTESPRPTYQDVRSTNWAHPTDADEVALALVAASLLHGAMVVWGAEPALERLLDVQRIALCWLRPAQAPAPARHRWKTLLGLGGRL